MKNVCSPFLFIVGYFLGAKKTYYGNNKGTIIKENKTTHEWYNLRKIMTVFKFLQRINFQSRHHYWSKTIPDSLVMMHPPGVGTPW